MIPIHHFSNFERFDLEVSHEYCGGIIEDVFLSYGVLIPAPSIRSAFITYYNLNEGGYWSSVLPITVLLVI